MRLSPFVILGLLLLPGLLPAQNSPVPDLPTDYLSPEFHAGRRAALRELMPRNSVVMVAAYPTRKFSNDVDYVYHPSPDLYYFTGYKEPNALLLLFKEPQVAPDGDTCTELFFVQERNVLAERWTGRRLGAEGVREQLKIAHAYNGKNFKDLKLDLKKFDQVLFDRLPLLPANSWTPADLANLISQFREKAGITDSNLEAEKKFNSNAYFQLTGQLREIKTEEEMVLLRKAIEISCNGQAEVMKAVRPDMSEREIQGLHEYVHKKYGAEHWGYPAIVGAGNNGCVLHYQDNNRLQAGNRLVLMDVGAEYHGYTADVTRTIPANGQFSPDQKAIYQLVYEAQEAAFKLCRAGATWGELDKAARDGIAAGLLKLGIIKQKSEVNNYFSHGLGHHIGLDVHDRSHSPQMKKGMVITIEPGIYIPENSPCDPRWWGIGIRIEDDILIREKDYELLSGNAPRTVTAIERMIAEKSILENYQLPPLQSGKKGF
ncbi:MAG: aminopeptidase P family protein [Candidatus Pseudobacter hemicellulosilyticus]|uniref:Xaa-Pro aminopeptidase n=1 Tax=Candidatus Pseudobacter hemicellulosilyticus TaxID=3121375 RepID=A0AAJ5WP63_9BACT|nr:MAG: aminopeptidase P family protein [Pseudobacter sp.]